MRIILGILFLTLFAKSIELNDAFVILTIFNIVYTVRMIADNPKYFLNILAKIILGIRMIYVFKKTLFFKSNYSAIYEATADDYDISREFSELVIATNYSYFFIKNWCCCYRFLWRRGSIYVNGENINLKKSVRGVVYLD